MLELEFQIERDHYSKIFAWENLKDFKVQAKKE